MRRPNWHELAARVQAQHPHWSWSQVCAEVAKSGRRKRAEAKVATAKTWYNDFDK